MYAYLGGGAVQVTFSHIKVDFLVSGHAVSPILCSKFQRKQKLCVSNFLVHPHIGRKSRVFLPSLFGGFFRWDKNMLPPVEVNLKFWASPTSRMGANKLPINYRWEKNSRFAPITFGIFWWEKYSRFASITFWGDFSMGEILALHTHPSKGDFSMEEILALHTHCSKGGFFDGRNTRALLPSPSKEDFCNGRKPRASVPSLFGGIFAMGKNLALQSHRCLEGFFTGS